MEGWWRSGGGAHKLPFQGLDASITLHASEREPAREEGSEGGREDEDDDEKEEDDYPCAIELGHSGGSEARRGIFHALRTNVLPPAHPRRLPKKTGGKR